MTRDFLFSGSQQIQERLEEAQFFVQNIIDPEEYPYFVSDEASVFDISSQSGEELRSRIEQVYGQCIAEQDLAMPLWQLLDHLRASND